MAMEGWRESESVGGVQGVLERTSEGREGPLSVSEDRGELNRVRKR